RGGGRVGVLGDGDDVGAVAGLAGQQGADGHVGDVVAHVGVVDLGVAGVGDRVAVRHVRAGEHGGELAAGAGAVGAHRLLDGDARVDHVHGGVVEVRLHGAVGRERGAQRDGRGVLVGVGHDRALRVGGGAGGEIGHADAGAVVLDGDAAD